MNPPNKPYRDARPKDLQAYTAPPPVERKRLRISDRGYVVIDNKAFVGPLQFYVTRANKKYGGTISNEGTTDIKVQLETGAGDIGLPKTLFPGTWLEFDDFPLSGITLYGTGKYSLMAWAGPNPFGKIKYYPRPTVNAIITGLPTPLPVSFATPVPVSGTFWPATQPVSGTVSVGNFPAGFNVNNWPATFPATQSGIWSVGINNFPNPQNVNIADYLGLAVGPLNPMDVKVSNFPATQPISGSVSVSNFPAGFNVNNWPATFPATQSGIWSVGINNFPNPQNVNIADYLGLAVGPLNPMDVKVSNFPATQPISGSVSVSNFPAGFNVNNFPASYAVTGTFWQATQPISGAVSVSNFPATYDVSDRAGRLLGVVYGNLDKLQQRGTTLELLVQLVTAGTQYDARQIRNLSSVSDSVLASITGTPNVVAYGNLGAALQQDPSADALITIPKAIGKTTINRNAQANNTSVSIYTVTAGKTFYLTYAMLQLYGISLTAAADIYFEHDVGGNGVFASIATLSCGLAGNTAIPLLAMPISPSVAMPFVAGTVFRVRSDSTAAWAIGALMGWEE